MELIQNSSELCTLRNGSTAAYHVTIAGDVRNDINVPELIPGQHVQFELAPPFQRKTGGLHVTTGGLHVTWENHLGEKQVLDFTLQ
ncbi:MULTISPECIES: hypothetical protein [Brevibacterium]|uniref:Uncharacterized protein n=1 Tax=Brevibacterium sediminis TaxID=1857024 RepID=A0A5C4X5Z3_9MICO|nr:hypothetical protein [Brevibacterium sediminis]TNM58027.1 hypothetical protein FHQ09_01740 [Brevibacterium sediminis]